MEGSENELRILKNIRDLNRGKDFLLHKTEGKAFLEKKKKILFCFNSLFFVLWFLFLSFSLIGISCLYYLRLWVGEGCFIFLWIHTDSRETTLLFKNE